MAAGAAAPHAAAAAGAAHPVCTGAAALVVALDQAPGWCKVSVNTWGCVSSAQHAVESVFLHVIEKQGVDNHAGSGWAEDVIARG